MKTKNSRAGIILVLIGFVCCLGAAALAIYNNVDSERAGRASEEVLSQLMDEIMDPDEAGSEGKDRYYKLDEPLDQNKKPEMAAVIIDGYEYIGMIAIPSLNNLELPVMKECDLDRLSISPCRYTGSYYSDDLVICGHNNSRHFGGLLDPLKLGADVYFITAGGEKIHYLVVNKEIVVPTDVAVMIENSKTNKDSDNDWDLTLFTCTYSGQTRCAVRCVKTAEDQTSQDR